MGEVFLARDKSTGKVCVIKRMLPNLMSDTQFVTMFLDEARLVAQLNHPNIAPLYDFGMAQGVLFLSMEYVPGANLRMIVKDHATRGVKIGFDAASRILSQAALALDYAHFAKTVDGKPLKLIHRDVSPQNILLSTSGVVKLIDFGVAKASTASQQTAAGLIKGKYAYMSPEQLRGQALDGRSDVYGLGLVLYELLALERAIPGRTDAEVAQNALHMRFAGIESKRPDIPARLREILLKALAKDVKARYQRAAELSSDLERFLADRRVSPSAQELAQLLPQVPKGSATVVPGVPWHEEKAPQPPKPPADLTPAFWENHVGPPTEASTDEGLPPTQQLTPSQLPVKSKQVDASEAPTAFAEDLKLPPPPPPKRPSQPPVPVPPRPSIPPPVPSHPPAPLSQSALQAAIRRSMLPWVISAGVLLFGAAALVWGFLLLNQQRNAAPVPVPAVPSPAVAVKPPEPPAPSPAVAAPPAPAVAEAAVDAGPVIAGSVDSAIVSVVSVIPAKISVDGAANGRVPLELSLSPGAHTLVFEDLATGIKHKRVVNLQPGDKRKETWNPERGKIVVRASPWAEIFVGDHSFGVTPIDAIEVVAGRHQFRFVNTDTKRTVQKVVDVPAGKETLVKVDLR